MPRFIEVAKTAQIPEHGIIGVEIAGKCLALVKLEGEEIRPRGRSAGPWRC